MMNHIKRNGFSMNRWYRVSKSYNGVSSLSEYKSANCVSDVGLAAYSSTATELPLLNDFVKRVRQIRLHLFTYFLAAAKYIHFFTWFYLPVHMQ